MADDVFVDVEKVKKCSSHEGNESEVMEKSTTWRRPRRMVGTPCYMPQFWWGGLERSGIWKVSYFRRTQSVATTRGDRDRRWQLHVG